MSKANYSSVVHLNFGDKAVATMLRGTSESTFTLLRGVPSNDDRRLDDYLWTEVLKDGKPVTLSLAGDNPIVIDVPGTYKFRNDGFEDEQAIIDITTYGRKLETTTYV